MFGSVFASFPPLRTEKPPAILHFLPVFSSFSPFSLLCAELPFVVRAQSNRRRGVAEHHGHACLCALRAQSKASHRRIVSRETIFCAFARANVHCCRWRNRRAQATCPLLLSEVYRDWLLLVSHILLFASFSSRYSSRGRFGARVVGVFAKPHGTLALQSATHRSRDITALPLPISDFPGGGEKKN